MSSILAFPKDLWRRDKMAFTALVLLVLLVLIGLLGPWLPIGDPTKIGAGRRLSAPTLALPFGTDELGRSFLPRVVQGIRSTFLLSAFAVTVTAVVGTFLGILAGYYRGLTDQFVSRGADILFAFPSVLVGLLIAAILGPGHLSAVAVISFATLPLFVRVVRSVTLGVASRGFVVAAEIAGASPWRIITLHILPNIIGPVIVQLTYALSVGMIIESVLSFLGLGVQPPDASLGSLLQQGSPYLIMAPWLVISSGVVLSLAIISVNLVGDAVRDRMEPLRGRSLE